MSLRRALLRTAFGSLALAAVFGAAGMVFAGHDALWRIVGTCVATSLAGLLMLGSAALLERDETRLSGAMSLLLFVVEYLVALGLIWEFWGRAEAQVGLTALLLALTAFPALVFLRISRAEETRFAARVGFAACAAAFSIFMVGTWGRGWGQWDAGRNRWFEVGRWLGAFALLAVGSLIGAGRDRRRWRWLGVAAAVGGFAIATNGVVRDVRQSSSLFVCLTSVAIVTAHANLLMRVRPVPGRRWLLWTTIGAAITAALLVDVASLARPWRQEILGRLAGAASIVGGCGTLALVVLSRVDRRDPSRLASGRDIREIALVCPRCGRRQVLAIGDGTCGACGLGISVRILPRPPGDPGGG